MARNTAVDSGGIGKTLRVSKTLRVFVTSPKLQYLQHASVMVESKP